jgi:putative DNA methylase
MERRFIESVNFPFSVISEASAVEKGPGRPPHWEMVFWWTRKPLISARAIIAGCLLPEKTSVGEFLYGIGVRRKGKRADGRIVFDGAPHRVKPRYRFEGVRLLDPFAGFGSIPLEGLRLGLDVTAVELLPVAYAFLKAVLEYPAKYGERLVRDVEKWGCWVTERLREDPLIRELYEDDVAVYIGSWEVKCPHCGRWTPLVGNWWLARVKAGEGYARLAWMEPVVEGDKVRIRVVDLNKVLGDRAVKGARVSGLRITAGGKEFRVPESNIEARREKAVCLLCHQPIMQIDPKTGKHYAETKNLPKEVKERLKSYVKFALELSNKGVGYGANTELPPWINEVPARQKLLIKVKVKQGDLEFEPCTEKDQEKLEKAKEEVKKLLETNDPDVPRESISLYSVRYLFPILYGVTEWYKLFNPRQLLTLVKLVKLIREAGKQIEQEKLKAGLRQEEAGKHAEAITTYLTIALLRFAEHTSLVTPWTSMTGFGSALALKPANVMTFRGIAMTWNWCDTSPPVNFAGSYTRALNTSSAGLSYLVSAVPCGSSEIRALLDDATMLSKHNAHGKFILIATDPPYYDDVPYAELSDFYYVWLKRALSDVEDACLVPRFLPEAFFEKVGEGWVEVSTQWEKYALSEVSLNPPRLGATADYEDGVRHFQNLLNASFVTMASKLKDDGLLVTYYAHTDPDAWKALLEAGWGAAGFKVTNAFPITTESTQSVVKRGKLSMDTSIVVVWRKKSEGAIEASELYNQMAEESVNRARELMDIGAIGRDLVIGTLAASLAVATKYREIKVMGKIDTKTLIDNYVYPATYLGLAKALAIKAELKEGVKHPDAMFYLLVKSILPGAKKKTLESTDLRLFSIGTSLDLNTAIKSWRILKGEAEPGAKVAKAKTYTLVEPPSDERSKIAEILEVRGLNPENPQIRCTVDALHMLEYYAATYSREEFKRKIEELKTIYPSYTEEALTLEKILAKTLPKEDPEWSLCKRIVDYLSPEQKPLFPEKGD